VIFVEQLRSRLESLSTWAGSSRPQPSRVIDPNALSAYLLGLLRSNESNPAWVARVHRHWVPRIPAFAAYLSRLAPQVAPVADDEALEFGCRALDCALDSLDPSVALVDRLELQRVVSAFGWESTEIDEYALELRLARRSEAGELRLAPLGRTFLQLRGRDAIHWLLSNELAQSTGRWDPWRAGSALLEEAMSDGGLTELTSPDGEPYFPYANETLVRLSRVGVLLGHASGPDEDPYRYEVGGDMRELVMAVLDRGPWHAAVCALLEDERRAAVPILAETVAHATVEQTRMIAHELRNALVPVRHHVVELLRVEVLDAAHDRLEAVRRGVVRVLDFVDQLVEASELVSPPISSFDLTELIREGIDWTEDGADRVQLVGAQPLRIRAPREQLLRAVINLIRNALQASDAGGSVRVSLRATEQDARIEVDDAGPGIHTELRERVFDDGFTTRPGGTGFGLAFVRRVVQGESRGRVWCEDSDLGGARFVIAIPRTEPQG
jgi:signal transduction histidine kinase